MAKKKASISSGKAAKSASGGPGKIKNAEKKTLSKNSPANWGVEAYQDRSHYDAVTLALQHLRNLTRDPDNAYRRACSVLEEYRGRICKLPGFKSVEVGLKEIGTSVTRIFAIRIIVSKKHDPTNPDGWIPPHIEGVPTDVLQECEFSQAAPIPGTKIDVAPSGKDGTLGGYVRMRGSKQIRYLTCAHVIGSTSASNVLQLNNVVGTITPSPQTMEKSARVDCAIVTPMPRAAGIQPISNGPNTAITIASATPSDMNRDGLVWKRGAETGLTYGTLTSINSGSWPIAGAGNATNQYIVKGRSPNEPFAKRGDSGAFVCIGNFVVGLVRAVNDATGQTLVMPLDYLANGTTPPAIERFDLF
ncbi:MAG: hypothetical protein JNM43_11230 [Planctomycetaceae bacterium]|nr:hypothetical protein [Planctomycetaceae bacterium]